MDREKRTIEAMVRIYCRANHGMDPEGCPDCRMLIDYALSHLDDCPFQEDKPTCLKCTIHCYRPEMREKIREVMRYSGPRMMVHHPILAIGHLADGLRDQRTRRE
ncbi:MAG: nitrous oxide-stimulated promoter family protein [Methanomassiliicoccus sp.]|nr:nitrous oxide-stimulated promoter family protein [Methanomassiliicoccus sp.]